MTSPPAGLKTKTAIIIGASSGIGESLAEHLSGVGYRLVLTGRRTQRLDALRERLSGDNVVQYMDVSAVDGLEDQFERALDTVGKADLVVISAGIGHPNPSLDVSLEQETLNTNVRGFVTLACAAFRHFERQGGGHLVGISSVAGQCGNAGAPAYSASKAFVSNYLEGLRLRSLKDGLNITVTDIRPGFVDTAMAQGEGLFWVASPQRAALQIVNAISRKSRRAYVTKRWRLIAWLLKWSPDWLLKRM